MAFARTLYLTQTKNTVFRRDRVEILRVLQGARDLEDILSNLDEEI
ncbi:hypothetical protein H6G50_23750 [Oscillatoria sp. FACHB-1406]|nr:hypothetical protein [Oscillatoria sp. FACHB-1406]